MDKHLSLSFELIYLMGWLLKHEKGMLNSLIKHALKNGLAHDLEKVQIDAQGDASQELQSIILDFLAFLERSLAKNLDATHDATHHDATRHDATHRDAQHHSDQKQQPDANELKIRLQRARQLLTKELAGEQTDAPAEKKGSGKTVKKELFNDILKTWKPNKKDLVH